jgi:hypothetical protein
MPFLRRVQRSFSGIGAGLALVLLTLPFPSHAQALSGVGLQGLQFGDVLPGVPSTVPPSDAVNAASFEIRGQRNREVLISFLLPPALNGPGAGTIPLTFGPGSAAFVPFWFWPAYRIPFDPTVQVAANLSFFGRSLVLLGGTASPPSQTPAGSYSADVVLTLAYTGN